MSNDTQAMSDCDHENMVPDLPHHVGGDWIGHGYICANCGFQTVRVETYTPVEKPCPKCGATFEGMDDVPDELCTDCVKTNVAAWIKTQNA